MPEQEELVVDLPETGPEIDVEVEDSEDVEASSEEDQEHLEYSKKVQKRIDKLTKKAREAERQQEAALNYAKNIQAENNALKNRVDSLDRGYVAEYGDRIATQSEALQKDLETAIATSDTASQVELNKKLAQLAIEEERVRAAQAQQKQQEQYQAQAMPQAPQPQPQAPVRPDPKAEDWAEKNPWFGQDEAMTFAAFGIHKKLVEEEAFDTESPEYYDELDKRLQEAFPQKLNGNASTSDSRRPQQAVASATRSSSSGRKTVRLSPSEVTIANKLGVPLDEYAKYKR
tara:strand:- start:1500 stop:2360 length:861 start_codon:yes stop_codon:yes gene_type:complete